MSVTFESGSWYNGETPIEAGVTSLEVNGVTYVLVDRSDQGHQSIQEAVANATAGATILVASGTYSETVIVTQEVIIKSLDGAVATTVIEGGFQILADGVTLDGLSINNGGAFVAEPAAGVFVQAANVTISNSILTGPNAAESSRGIVTDASAENLTLSDNQVSGWATGAYLNPGATGTVEGNLFKANNVGMSMDDPNGLSVTGNTFDANTLEQIGVAVPGDALDLSKIVMENEFVRTPEGKQQVFVYGDSSSEVISGTAAADAISGGAGNDTVEYADGAVIDYDADAQVWTVTIGNVVDTLDGIEKVKIGGETYILAGGGAHASLTAALADAIDGQTILVAAGTYAETITITKDVTLKSVNAGKAVLNGGIHVMANGVTIDGFTINGGDTFFGSGPAGILVQANGVTLQNNVLNGSETSISGGARGVLVATGTGQNLTISNNEMKGWATGIYANDGASGTVSGNTLTANNVGMSADGPGALTITGNKFTTNITEQLAFGVTGENFNVADYLAGGNIFTGTAPEVSVWDISDKNQTITGSQYEDALHGLDGNDILIGGGGDDAIDGGEGVDTAVFSGKRSDYTFTVDQDGKVTITDQRANGGTDTDIVSDVEFFQFANGTISLDTLVNNEAPTSVSLAGDRRVAENAANGTVIGALSATDENADDTHVYDLVDSAGGRFAISGGKLVVANGSLLDYEKATSHLVKVKVTDFSGASFVQDLTITLGNVNEAPTDIVVSGGTILENSAKGTEVASLSGVDQDAGETFSFSLLDNAGGRFVIGGANGDKILVADSFKLDYEQATSHQVVVRVTDKSGASYNETLTLAVADVRTETVTGTSGSDQISGGTGKDVLNGGTGNDRLTGGVGKDTLTGGSGKDVFVFGNKDTGTSKGTADYITDFSGRGGDKIDLKLIDADTKKKGDQAFSFIGTKDFTKAGQVRYEKSGKDTYVYLNTDSDKSAEGVIKLKGAIDLQKGWFVL